jgi:hypothetical protein
MACRVAVVGGLGGGLFAVDSVPVGVGAQPGRRRTAVLALLLAAVEVCRPVWRERLGAACTQAVSSNPVGWSRSGNVGGAVLSSVQAGRRWRQCSGGVALAARPSGQQMSCSLTLVGTA